MTTHETRERPGTARPGRGDGEIKIMHKTFKYLREDDDYVYFSDYENNEIRFTKQFYKLDLGGKDEIEVHAQY